MVYPTPTMRDDFSTLDIQKALKIERERLRDWMSRGFIVPSVQAKGQGSKAVFTRYDVYGIALFNRMIEYGLNRKDASEYIKSFIEREKWEPDRQKTNIIKLVVRHDGKSFSESITNTDFIIDLSNGMTSPKNSLNGINPIAMIPVMKERYSEKWEIITLINFKNLCEDVDSALKTL